MLMTESSFGVKRSSASATRGTRTRTGPGLNRMPLPLDYGGVTSIHGWQGTATNTVDEIGPRRVALQHED